MKKFCSMVLLVLCVVGLSLPAAAQGYDLPAEISITAAEAYFINLDTGLVVYEKDADTPRSIASLTKLMTSLLLMENVQDLENTMITAERNLYVGSIIDPSSSNRNPTGPNTAPIVRCGCAGSKRPKGSGKDTCKLRS